MGPECLGGKIGPQLVYAASCDIVLFFFSSRRRHTRLVSDWSSDVCSSDLNGTGGVSHQICSGCGFGEGDYLADRFLTCKQHYQPVESNCHAPVWGCAVFKRDRKSVV